MATDFKYASQSDLEMYYSAYSQFNAKRQIFGWTLLGVTYQDIDTSTSCYIAENVGLISNLFIDGQDMSVREQSIPSIQSGNTNADTAEAVQYGETEITTENTHNLLVDPGWIIGIGSGVPEKMLVTDSATANTIKVRRGFDGTSGETSSYSTDANIFYWTKLSQKGEWTYSANDDCLLLTWDSDPGDSVIEGGQDNTTYFDQMLVNASMELNSLLDKRFPMPLPKFAQFDLNTSYTSSGVEYDAIIIKSTCYIVASNLMRQANRGEEADYYYNLVINAEGTGIVDRLNKGESKLAFETDHQDSKGKVREITKSGTMSLIETYGAYDGELFELFEIECTTGGAYGAAEVSVKSYGSDKLLGTTTTGVKITGGLQHVLSGWYARWQGASMTSGDKWEVQLYSDNKKVTNTDFGSVELSR